VYFPHDLYTEDIWIDVYVGNNKKRPESQHSMKVVVVVQNRMCGHPITPIIIIAQQQAKRERE